MATITKLVPGQVVYSIRRQKMGNTTVSYNACYTIKIVSINIEAGSVVASWNGNRPQTFYSKSIKSWKVKEPVPKTKIFGMQSY
jgi:uncharacterized protein YcnI